MPPYAGMIVNEKLVIPGLVLTLHPGMTGGQ
jgi:hypothetical protein